MSKFVNFGKRGVQLPPGCKDLIDVLQPERRERAGPSSQLFSSASPKIIRDESVTARVAQVGKYVAELFSSHAWTRQLGINSPDDKLALIIYATDDARVARLWLIEDQALDRQLRDFMACRGLERPPPKNECVSPISFGPNVPVQVVYPLSPVPADPSALSNLVELLLHDVGGLRADSKITIHYFEAERE